MTKLSHDSRCVLSIGIVSTNEKDYLQRCLSSLLKGIPEGITSEMLVIDNASTDGTADLLRTIPGLRVTNNADKKGFSENLNIIIRESEGEFLLVIDANAFVTHSYVKVLLDDMSDPHVGVVSGKLLKASSKGAPLSGKNGKRIIDSAGHIIYRDLRVVNRGELEEDSGQYEKKTPMFGLCTAATLFRRSALDSIILFGEYFDESFYSHKEDVDVCWRLGLNGWSCVYDPSAIAYHTRSWAKNKGRGSMDMDIRRNSYKNRYLMMIKNVLLADYMRMLPWIILYELKSIAYVLLREPYLLLTWPRIIGLLPLTFRKRRVIMNERKASGAEARQWYQ